MDESTLENVPVAHKGTILLVEDDEFLRGLVVRALEGAGYEVLIAKDGEEALAHAARRVPNLILLDLVLPGYSGFELMAKLREQEDARVPARSPIPFIVLSNSAETQSKKQAEEMSAKGYLVKAQSTPLEIVAAVDAWFAAHPGTS